MDIFNRHEIFEIEVLEKMKSTKILDPLVFGGGTMLRLCHELGRYSVDLDFWFIKEIPFVTPGFIEYFFPFGTWSKMHIQTRQIEGFTFQLSFFDV